MSEHGTQLHETADHQISELVALLSARDQATLSLPCPGREKLGDGTVAAVVSHTTDNYLRIAGFSKRPAQRPAPNPPGAESDNLVSPAATHLPITPKADTNSTPTAVKTRRRESISPICSNGCQLLETPSASSSTSPTTNSRPCHPPAASGSAMGGGP